MTGEWQTWVRLRGSIVIMWIHWFIMITVIFHKYWCHFLEILHICLPSLHWNCSRYYLGRGLTCSNLPVLVSERYWVSGMIFGVKYDIPHSTSGGLVEVYTLECFIAAAAEAMKKWDGGHSQMGRSLGRRLIPPQFRSGVLPPGNFWKYRCNSVHFGGHQVIKSGTESTLFCPTFKSGTEFTVPTGSTAPAF